MLTGVRTWVQGIRPQPGTLRQDLIAGIPDAISSVPDGMATSVLAGVNPVHGLYASTFGPVAGGLTSSTRLMVITTTSAAALAAGSALEGVDSHSRPHALFLLTLIAGGLMVTAGAFRLGRYTRFVPHSVMIGFLSGVAVNIVLGQLPSLVGSDVTGSPALAKAWNLLTHPGTAQLGSTLCGLFALATLAGLSRTRLSPYSSLFALVIPSVIVAVVGASQVRLVSDVGAIPHGLPLPYLPRLSDLSIDLLVGAASVAVLVLVQGAGVSESAPNPDGSRSDPNKDFVAQGVGNLAAGLFRGQPVGGSVGQTAVSVSAGARGRWAGITSGLLMALILLLFSSIVGSVVMSTLAAVLIYAAVSSFRGGAVRAILRTGRNSQIGVIVTFVATLLLPVAAAVGVGVIVALSLQLNQEALDLRVVQLIPDEQGSFHELPAPKVLASQAVTLLDVYGSLYYAGARTLQARLPDPTGATRAVVVLRLRGRAMLGSTCFVVLSDYARRLSDIGGRLYLSGVDPAVVRQIKRERTVERVGDVQVFEATATVGETSLAAYRSAEEWLQNLS